MARLLQHESWSSRAGFLLATIGAAVGLGSIWKFPYLVGTSGGGAFVIVYVLAVVAVAIPIVIAELMLGRRGHQSPPTAMRINAELEGRAPSWALVGWLGTVVGFLILSFFNVIGGWVIDYLVSATGGFADMGGGRAAARFQQLLDDPVRMTLGHSVYLGMTCWITSRGVRRGIEQVSRILMPALFVMLLALVGYAAVAGDLAAGLHFMFAVDFDRITPAVALVAVGQAFLSIGVSMGLMMTYGAYLSRDISIPFTAVVIAGAVTLVSILAGVAIFPLVFANNLEPTAGPGLIFVTLPIAFGSMPGGTLIGVVFFLLLLIAAITSSIAILEPIIAWSEERWRVTRRRAVLIFGVLAWLLGLLSVLSFNVWQDVRPAAWLPALADKTFFDLADYFASSLMMPLGGMLIAIFAGWRMSRATLLTELGLQPGFLFQTWRWLLRVVVPLSIGALLLTAL